MNETSTGGPDGPPEGGTAGATAPAPPPDGGQGETQADRSAAKRLASAGVTVLRQFMPLIQAYARLEAGATDSRAAEPGRSGLLTLGEETVLSAAGKRAAGETLAFASVTQPVAGNAPYVPAERAGEFQPPNLRHLRSLLAVAQGYLGGDDDDQPGTPEPAALEEQRVAYLAVAPGEFQVFEGPVTPTQARRSAMRLRTFDPPPPAMLAQSQPRDRIVAGAASGKTATISGARPSGSAYGARADQGGQTLYAACACCGGARHPWTFPPAQRDDEGKCKSVFSISCETQWRLRECFKVSFCELLRCLGEELCDDGGFAPRGDRNFERCLEGFVCTLIACLPEAICPAVKQEYCAPAGALSCECNFAVGE